MQVREILQQINLGNPVAEYDKGLPHYFLTTEPYNRLITGRADMVTGEKGTGKTAIYKYLQQCKNTQPELRGIQIIPGINPAGEPLFRRFGEEQKLDEGQYVTIWKLYFLSLIANWVIKNAPKPTSRAFVDLESLLSRTGLLSNDGSPGTVFPRLMAWLREHVQVTGIGVNITFNEYGFPVWTPKMDLGSSRARPPEVEDPETVSHAEAFTLLETVLYERGQTIWVIMDRLDESFISRPDIEIPALRALVRTFMDLYEYSHIRIKLFVRSDLFRKITQGGFVNLTHVNARRVEIIWDDDDLLAILCQRIRGNREPLRMIGVNNAGNRQLFHALIQEKIDPNRNQLTWKWILNQIRDGNGVKAPRNLIDLITLAQDEQMLKERSEPREFTPGMPLIESRSIRAAAVRLSTYRLEDTLLAEYAQEMKVLINAFRNSKAEQNDESIARKFQVDLVTARLYARALMDIGFFEGVGDTYKIPFLYRAALNITQGKAFNGNGSSLKK